MNTHRLPAVVLWTLVAGAAIACRVASATASQDSAPQAWSAQRTDGAAWEHFVAGQMEAAGRHARVDMILYPGRFADSERAATRVRLDAVALRYARAR